ncbi:SSI family serine proteinase inhibitor [Streptomyces sp. NPDC048361]|uniref:SSI family serine proteinase inhibitor n=1 Tax=Streptomyces sp. NPDC048361 TaxID=3154720 RepID=UPI0034295F7B
MRKITAVSAVAVALLANGLAGTGLGSAAAAPAGTMQPMSLYAPSALVLTIEPGTGDQQNAVQRAVTLNCAPKPSGTHPAAAAACAELRRAQGDFAALVAPGAPRLCTKLWNPVTVRADGVWDGKHVSHVQTYGNSCMKDAGSEAVFNF